MGKIAREQGIREKVGLSRMTSFVCGNTEGAHDVEDIFNYIYSETSKGYAISS